MKSRDILNRRVSVDSCGDACFGAYTWSKSKPALSASNGLRIGDNIVCLVPGGPSFRHRSRNRFFRHAALPRKHKQDQARSSSSPAYREYSGEGILCQPTPSEVQVWRDVALHCFAYSAPCSFPPPVERAVPREKITAKKTEVPMWKQVRLGRWLSPLSRGGENCPARKTVLRFFAAPVPLLRYHNSGRADE